MNLTAPVMQLNAVVTLVLAVVILREPCTMLQVAGAILMVAGSLVTQRASQPASSASPKDASAFRPRVAAGFLFASIAALAYGTSPIIVRQALLGMGPLGGLSGGSVAYALVMAGSRPGSAAASPPLAASTPQAFSATTASTLLMADIINRRSVTCPRGRI